MLSIFVLGHLTHSLMHLRPTKTDVDLGIYFKVIRTLVLVHVLAYAGMCIAGTRDLLKVKDS